MTANLPATPPADEALQEYILQQFRDDFNHVADGRLLVRPGDMLDFILELIKSHAEQEKAAADLALAKEITWHIANLAYAHGFRGSPFIQNELKLAQERLAELRDGGGK